MQSVETILTLLGLTTALAFVAHKAKVPYPILLVVGGMGLAFVPGLPAVSLDPQLVFLFFLPPILYAAGYFTSWRDFRSNIVSITLLAVGLVVATTLAVAAVVVALVPGVPWPAALVLGAIVSPPDAVAATAIAQRVRLPRQIVTILEGESLVNDATGLVLLKFASAAIVTGHLAVLPGIAEFCIMVVGGIAVGLALGWLFAQSQRFLDDTILMTTASLLVSFVIYIAAEHVHVSGVLATVTAGVVQGRYVPRILSSKVRIESTTVWATVIFLLNALVFVLIGLQLPVVLRTLDWPWPVVVDGIFATFGTMVVVRLVWMFPGAYLPRLLFPKYRARHPYPPWQAVAVVGWAGMRGVVSLAAALSLPLLLADGRPFPARSLIIFITFAVILGTLVFQGLTLAPLVSWLRVEEDRSGAVEEHGARLALAEAALAHLDETMDAQNLQAHQVHNVRQEYAQRLRSLKGLEADGPAHATLALSRELRRTAIEAQRRQLLNLRDQEVIGDDVLHRLQHELDLEDLRMR
ncbi:MAG TPA: Na+/H+ antiporter [Thermoanaerobaculia bacterium]|nr:Na+/H+ antiporter [Thermoanaerobaculia bacterium]